MLAARSGAPHTGNHHTVQAHFWTAAACKYSAAVVVSRACVGCRPPLRRCPRATRRFRAALRRGGFIGFPHHPKARFIVRRRAARAPPYTPSHGTEYNTPQQVTKHHINHRRAGVTGGGGRRSRRRRRYCPLCRCSFEVRLLSFGGGRVFVGGCHRSQ